MKFTTSQMVAPLKYAPTQKEATSQTTINPTMEYIAAKVADSLSSAYKQTMHSDI